jgi:hypothetical protein
MDVQTNQPTFLFLILERTLDNKLSISISQGQIHTHKSISKILLKYCSAFATLTLIILFVRMLKFQNIFFKEKKIVKENRIKQSPLCATCFCKPVPWGTFLSHKVSLCSCSITGMTITQVSG